MTDERILEVMAKAALFFDLDETQEHAVELVERQLAALRAEGFDLYRPDDCEKVEVEDGGEYADYQTGDLRQSEPLLRGRRIHDTRCLLRVGTYRLVPVGGEG